MASRAITRTPIAALAVILVLSGCASLLSAGAPAPVSEIAPGLLAGYLPKASLPDSLALLPPPPATGTAAMALDEAFARSTFAQRGSPRWALAEADANLAFPEAAGVFSCALGAPISQEATPRLYRLLRRTLTDAGLSTYGAKNRYQRARPFAANEQPICTEGERAALAKDGSYPSGHTAIGWAWALVLSEIAPDRANALFARGLAYGESRNICNVHWRSDVQSGLVMGAATVARLHADAEFRHDLDAANTELANVRAKGLRPGRDCAQEAAALAPPAAADGR